MDEVDLLAAGPSTSSTTSTLRAVRIPIAPMPVPVPCRSSFAPATLALVEKNAASFRVEHLLFFRSVWTADVVENGRRSYLTEVTLDGARVKVARCACSPSMRQEDLCRHTALLVASAHDADGRLVSEEFAAGVWWKVGLACSAAGLAPPGDVPPEDAREQRLRAVALSMQEKHLLLRGSGSARLLFETSAWYRWAKGLFLRRGEGARVTVDGMSARLAVPGGETILPPDAVEHLIAGAPSLVKESGYEIDPSGLTPSLRIEITGRRDLRFVPVLLAARGEPLERASLPRFGRWFLAGNRFCSAAPSEPMFVTPGARTQAQLFEVHTGAGIPVEHETVIAEEEAFAFVQAHRDELARMPEELAPEAVRDAVPVRLDGEVVFDFAGLHGGLLELEVRFGLGGEEWIGAADIARARRDGVRALVRGTVWIDVTDPQFAWMDDAKFGPGGRMLATRLELLRMRGSLRGNAIFRGHGECEPFFRLFDGGEDAGIAAAPPELGLYGYQQSGFRWLWLLQQNGLGGLLCDDMGLGKTHQAIALIAGVTRLDPAAPVLVVCPTSVLDHWRDRLGRYLPGVAVTLASYGQVRARIEQFRGRKFDLLVLDEAQTIKNADTATYQALAAIERRVAVGLTGTPIENHEGELRTLLDFVVPGYLPRHVDERTALRRLVKPFVLRRTKEQVLTELPPKIVDKRYCDLTEEQRTVYRRVLESRASPLREQLRGGGKIPYLHVFAALNYLKQVCNHPASAGGGFAENVPSAKWEMFVELLDECMTSGLKVVVFSQYLGMLALIEDHLFRAGIGYASIHGSTRDRGGEIARFRDDPACRVFTASLRAGGLGIDLTSASVVIHYDRWWNQAREDQATDRVHRLGQTRGVQVIKLITRRTIEEKIDQIISSKAGLAAEVVQADDPSLVKQFTREEIEELLSF